MTVPLIVPYCDDGVVLGAMNAVMPGRTCLPSAAPTYSTTWRSEPAGSMVATGEPGVDETAQLDQQGDDGAVDRAA